MTRTMLALFVLCVPALARDNGQYNSVSPEARQWFRAQKSPKTGGLCCNEADGTYAEEDIRNGVYWTRFELTNGEWIPVPTDVVIKDPNRNGAPVAWWYFQDGNPNPLLCPRGRRVMGVVNGLPMQSPPTNCAYCRQLFKQKENHLVAWRSASGKLYCSEFCADDEEEAAFQNIRCGLASAGV